MTTKRTPPSPNLKSPTRHRLAATVGIGIVIFVIVVGGGLIIVRAAYADRVLPRTSIATTPVGGQLAGQIEALVRQYAETIENNGIVFRYGGRDVVVNPTVSATDDPDLTYELFSIDPKATAANAFVVGHRRSWTTDINDLLTVLLVGRDVPVVHRFDTDAVYQVLKENFGSVDQPAVNASLSHHDGSFTVTGENSGQVLDYQSALASLKERLLTLSTEPITLGLVMQYPTVVYAEAQTMIGPALQVLTLAPLTVRADDETTWEINKDTLGSWLTVVKKAGRPRLGLREGPVASFLADKKATYDVSVKEGKFNLANGRVTEFQPSQTGREIIISESIEAIRATIVDRGERAATLTVKTEEPGTATDEVNQLGIKELIGVGKSNFAGSPTNRRKNIALGAAMLHGQLIEPGEEFSLVAALNRFNPADGWLPELVIKGNRTIPEIGGGACQFGTTMFRAALNTGLPITKRQNHSYTVRYYFPIGTDATIYDPAPDFRYSNDTGYHILIQTRIEDDDLIFEMWGTRDGRVASQTDPVLSNWIAPPPKQVIETTDLAPGEVKCTEKPHSGVTASFHYSVTYPNGEIKEETFASKYKPWQEVCLVGVAPKA